MANPVPAYSYAKGSFMGIRRIRRQTISILTYFTSTVFLFLDFYTYIFSLFFVFFSESCCFLPFEMEDTYIWRYLFDIMPYIH